MDFITIDFETATAQRDSPCEIGLTFVEAGQIVDTKSWLIKPKYDEFDFFNVMIHGITPEDVAREPEFNELWDQIRPLIENKLLIAHNASFDISVLRRTLEAYQLPFPKLNYSCSYIFSKKIWEGMSGYDLKTLCRFHNINLTHHRAGADSRATAELSLRAFEIAGVACMDDFPEKLKTSVGELYTGGYRPCETKRVYKPKDLSKIVGDPAKHNPESLFHGRTVVFTGTLSSMVRVDAQQIIADLGGIPAGGVTKDTDFLVVGQQDYRVVGEEGMSTKQGKAVKMIQNGAMLEILSEADFLKSI